MISKKPLVLTTTALGETIMKVAKSVEEFSLAMQGGNVRRQIKNKWILESKKDD
jgi:hypothetical protein